MAFDGFLTRGIKNELSNLLVGGRIDKIYHPSRLDLIFVIHNNKNKYQLFLSADSSHFGAYIVDDKVENPKTPTSFTMLLRKHLTGGKITFVEQKNWERIIEIGILSKDEMGYPIEKKVIIEIMNKHSNIIIVNSNTNRIIDALKRVSLDTSSIRQLLPSMEYHYPPDQNKITPEDFANNLEGSDFEITDYKDILNNVSGVSPSLAMSLFESNSPRALMQTYIDKVNSYPLNSVVYLDDTKHPNDFHTLGITIFDGLKQKEFSTISQGVSYYYSNREESNRLRQKSSTLEKTLKSNIKKLSLKKQRLLEDVDKAKKAEIYQLYGELLTANLYAIKDSNNSAKVLNYYDNTQIEIPLDSMLSPIENAQAYFKKYNKAKRALVEKNIQLFATENELTYLNTTLDLLQLADRVATIESIKDELVEGGYIKESKSKDGSKKSSKLDLFHLVSPSGKTIYIGRNNKENDYLSTKFASNSDLWFHTKDISGSHLILQLKGESPTDEDIEFTARLAAYYSKGRMSDKVPVDYTYIKHVKKPKGAKLGMVIFTNNKTVYVKPNNHTEN